MIPDDPGCTWVFSGNFQNFMIFMKISSVHPEESASHPLSLCNRECPEVMVSAVFFAMFGGSQLALRVIQAETRLTVYRLMKITRRAPTASFRSSVRSDSLIRKECAGDDRVGL